MNPRELMAHLRALDVRLTADGDALRCNGPVGVLTPDLRSELRANKDALIARLRTADLGAEFRIRPRTPGAPVPVSLAQERLWFLEQMSPGSGAYNITEAVQLRGVLDVHALERSLGEIVRRHEALRTNVIAPAGQPLQLVNPDSGTDLHIVDLSHLPRTLREPCARSLVVANARRAPDIARDRLVRFTVARVDPECWLAVAAAHHIVADGWSMGILMRELSECYSTLATGGELALRPVALNYGDYAVWQRDQLQEGGLDERLMFWQRELADARVLDLPADYARTEAGTTSGAQARSTVARATVDALASVGHTEGATLFMTLHAAFAVLLSKYLDTDDVVTMTRVAGRPLRDTEDMIGLFLTPLILRTRLSGAPTFRELLARVRQTCVAAYVHLDVPSDLVARLLAPARVPGHPALPQIMMTLQNYPEPRLALHGLEVRPFEVDQTAAWLDLDLSLVDSPAGLDASLTYRQDVFTPQTASRILEHFAAVMEQAAARPDHPVSDLLLLDSTSAVTRACGVVVPIAETTIHEMFEAQAARTPGAPALIGNGEQQSFAEVNAVAGRIARRLRRLGAGPDVPIAVAVESPLRRAIALLAVLKAGGAYLPVDPQHPTAYQASVRTAAGATRTIDDAAVAAAFAEDDVDGDGSTAGPAVRAANAAYIMCTSGSDGVPKAVSVSHAAWINRWAWTAQLFPAIPGEVAVQHGRISFAASLYELLGPLLQGIPTVLAEPAEANDPASLVATLEHYGVTRLVIVPTLLGAVLSEPDISRRLSRLRVCVVLGERLPDAVSAAFRRRLPHVQLWNDYGATEVTAIAYRRIDAVDRYPERCIGQPGLNTTVYVLDGRLRSVPPGVTGEICVSSAGLARGYAGRPDLTALRFVPDPFSDRPGARLYRTGDIGRAVATGIEHLGRRDQQVKIRGARVELEAIEATLAAHDSVADAAVARVAAANTSALVAYIVPARAASPSNAALRGYLENALPPWMIPGRFVRVDALPRTVTGKLDRRALAHLDGVDLPRGTFYVPPRTSVERDLANVFEEVLTIEAPGIHDSFFRLGGDSILSVRLAARIREAGYAVTPAQIFQYPAIADLAGVATPIGPAERQRTSTAAVPPQYPYARLTPQELDRFLSRLAPNAPQSAP